MTAVLSALLMGCGGSDGHPPAAQKDAAHYRDVVGDGGSLPDIRRIDVTSTRGGQLSFRISLGQLTPRLRSGIPVSELWLDTDADPETGNTTFEGAGGADYLLFAFFGVKVPSGPFSICGAIRVGNGCLSKWSESGWTAAPAPSARVSRTASGFTFSINRSDLGRTDEFNFFALRGADAPGFPDRAPGTGTFNFSLALGGPRPEASPAADEPSNKAGGKPEGKPVVLTLATHDYLQTNPEAASFIAALKRLSGGSIGIDLKDGWRFYDIESERGTIADAAHGDVDLALVGARVWDTVGVTSFRALVAPFLLDSFALQELVLGSPLVERMLEGVESRGLVGLAILPGALRRPLGFERVLVSPNDYEGADIGIRPGGVARATFGALAARAVGTSAEDFRPGQLPAFDGAELDVTTILNNRYDRYARALTANVVLWPRVSTLVMSRKAFDALTPEQQELLRAAGREALGPVLETMRSEEKASLAAICELGRVSLVTASAAERAALVREVQPVYDRLARDPLTREAIAEIRALRKGDSLATPPLRCPEAGPEAARTPLDGRWRADLSEEALRAAGATPEEVEVVQGPGMFEFARGRWLVRTETGRSVLRGTYTVAGSDVRLTITSCRPKSVCAPGQVTEYTWSVYRGKLTFAKGRRFAWPAVVAEPWTRVP